MLLLLLHLLLELSKAQLRVEESGAREEIRNIPVGKLIVGASTVHDRLVDGT